MSGIKKKDLEIKLEMVPSHPKPKASLEQYSTPSSIASDMLFRAFINGDVQNKRIADLGCGTGIFSVGASYLGARSVIGIDKDEEAINEAIKFIEEDSDLRNIKYEVKEVEEFNTVVDTVIMNPPFGAQNKGADLPFLKKSFEVSKTIYSIHNAETLEFLERFINDKGHNLFWQKRYMFEIDNLFEFHTEKKKSFEVVALGIDVKRE